MARRRGTEDVRQRSFRARDRAHLRRPPLGICANAGAAGDAARQTLARHARPRGTRRAARRSAGTRARAARICAALDSDHLYQRALRERRDGPAALWARRSWFAIEGDRLLVQEVFLPEAHYVNAGRPVDPDYKPEWKPHPRARCVPRARADAAQYALLMRLHKPIGIWLLLWPALWGLWIAGAGRPDPRASHHLHNWRRRDAIGRLRHQRLRGPRLRSASRAHPGSPARVPGASRPPRRCSSSPRSASSPCGLRCNSILTHSSSPSRAPCSPSPIPGSSASCTCRSSISASPSAGRSRWRLPRRRARCRRSRGCC